MTPPSNTPPNGDFVRYVEELTGANAAARLRDSLAPSQTQLPSPVFAPVARPGTPVSAPAAGTAKPAVSPWTGIAWLTHVKWLVGGWIASQVLAGLVPGAGFLFVPFLIAYAAWVFFTVNKQSSGALMKNFRAMAEAAAARAAEEARRAREAQARKPK
jgi:hypothetical protein